MAKSLGNIKVCMNMKWQNGVKEESRRSNVRKVEGAVASGFTPCRVVGVRYKGEDAIQFLCLELTHIKVILMSVLFVRFMKPFVRG